ncbi:MAG: ABC transporter ATP-binding protein [candidate division WOR-3 bacterium]
MARAKGKNGLGVVFEFWQRHKLLALGLFFFTALGGAVAVAFPYVLRLIVDGIKAEITQQKLIGYVLLLTGFGVVRALFDVILPFFRGRTNERFQWEVRTDVFEKILGKGYSFLNRFPSGDVMERLDHDLQELSWFACSGVFRFVAAFLLVIFTLIMLLRMNIVLTLVTVLPASLGVFVWMRMGPRIYSWFMKWREKIAEINNQLQTAFAGIRLVKAYVTEDRLAREFRKTLDGRVEVAVQEARQESRIQVFYMAIGQIAMLAVLWVGGIFVIGKSLTLGEFVAFNAYLLMLFPPMFDIGNLFVSGKRAAGAGERVLEMLEHRERVVVAPGAKKPEYGELRLERVSCSYNSHPVLKDVTMVFPKGSRVGIAGPVGSGKSTILRLILRLIEPDSGRVVLNRTDIRDFDIGAYRRLFGYAPQEPTLFSDTLKNNILFGREKDEEGLQRAVELAQLKNDVADFAQGFNEMLGERGTGLSGGQKARVALARALLEMPPFILLDDATSGLDADTEQMFFERLFNELQDRTIIIVSHRLKVLSLCDLIYCLDQGEVKEQGTHEGLLEKEGLYFRLYQRQMLKEELQRL